MSEDFWRFRSLGVSYSLEYYIVCALPVGSGGE